MHKANEHIFAPKLWDPSHRDLSAAARRKKEESRTIALGQGSNADSADLQLALEMSYNCLLSHQKKTSQTTFWHKVNHDYMMATETSRNPAHSRSADATGENACRWSPLWGSCGMASRSSNKKPSIADGSSPGEVTIGYCRNTTRT